MTCKPGNRSSRYETQAVHARVTAATAMLLSGCAAFGVGSPAPFGFTPPPASTPDSGSGTDQLPTPAASDSLGDPTTIEPQSTFRPPLGNGADLTQPNTSDLPLQPAPDSSIYGPELLPPTFDDVAPDAVPLTPAEPRNSSPDEPAAPEVETARPQAAASNITLKVTAPERQAVGQNVVFTLVVEGGSQLKESALTVEASFDEGLKFPGHTEKRLRQPLGTLSAGGTREITLALKGISSGRQCCRFTVSDAAGNELSARSACVELIEP